jgi:hypothetical protein
MERVGVRSALRRLDELLVPPMAELLARTGRSTGRQRMFTSAAAAFAVAGTVAAVYAAQTAPTGDPDSADVVRVGVARGGSIPTYAAESRTELAALPADMPLYALVTFTAYLAPDRLAPVLAPVATSSVYARVPLPRRQTELVRLAALRVPDDVAAAMDQTADRKDAEAAQYRQLFARAAGKDADTREVYADGADVAIAEATAYRRHCSCVFAAIVRGSPRALAAVAARPEVRVVDPAPEVTRLDRAVFLPPLPEQSGLVEGG